MPVPRGGQDAARKRPIAKLGGVPVPMPVPRPVSLASGESKRLLGRSSRRSQPPSWRAVVGDYSSESEAMADLVRLSELSLAGQGAGTFRIAKHPGPRGDKAYMLEMPGLSRAGAEEMCAVMSVLEMGCAPAPELPGRK